MSMTGPLSAEQFWRLMDRRLRIQEARMPIAIVPPPLAGSTIQRPDPSTLPAGTIYFDVDLGKPIWAFGAAWVAADGTAVP